MPKHVLTDEQRIAMREYSRQYYRRHKAKIAEKKRKAMAALPEHERQQKLAAQRAYMKAYRQANYGELLAYAADYRARKRAEKLAAMNEAMMKAAA
ncbi:MAG: hypothetical protein WBX25_27240 [Rhodomicrobium sp.]